ncbi:MAG: MarR family transcriptional regulator [Solirubrobacteraceae bacterium]|nr:MarR family transcriptional regulator [Solirubrobacteraceae bacterium]
MQTVGVAMAATLFDRLNKFAAARYPEIYGELELPKPALMLLVVLAQHGPLRQARLSERSGIDKASLVGLLNLLQERGLIVRDADPADRRAHAVSITPDGVVLLERAAELAAGDDFLSALSVKEQQTLVELLARVVAAHER